MARRLFFVPEFRRGMAELRGEEAHHLTRVLRVEKGQKYELSDNRSVWLAEVETARKESISFRLIEPVERPALPVRIVLYMALIKFERLEWAIEKATELGVEAIVPVGTSRSEDGLEKAAQKRLERWRKVAFEASQQSRRAHLARVEEPIKFAAALTSDANLRFFADETGGTPLANTWPPGRKQGTSIALLIGPEGGWTEAERQGAREAGWTPVTLGPFVLRAETAALAALAIAGSALFQTP
ncbi:MAG: 16S rRNA (uracil(1498)-N(3))-methyltransferase [Bryobacterales bacterium]|nr:16S rRNA (uracil(1498)-N(3))-methyltransferase [Bryobacterales bacterium]